MSKQRCLSVKPVQYLPGIFLSGSIAAVAYSIETLQTRLAGLSSVEALVIALMLGIGWRNTAGLTSREIAGVRFAGKPMLEFAIVLLGASVDFGLLREAGSALILATVASVAVGLAGSWTIGRLIGLNRRLAVLVAVGNSICGNSAIAAVAPVIDARPDEVASSIALTALLGVAMVVGLPTLIHVLHFGGYQYGVLAGMTVYAVPQVLAATFPIGLLSVQIATVVKLMRVLLLGPVILFIALAGGRRRRESRRIALGRMLPWFIAGFLVTVALRNLGVLSDTLALPLRDLSHVLTVIAMAALGLEADLASIRRVGLSVAATIVLSLTMLISVSALLIRTMDLV